MLGFSTDDPNGWLFNEIKSRSALLLPLGRPGCYGEILVHYSCTGKWPDFTSSGYHWTNRISNKHLETGDTAGWADPWTDVFFIKLDVEAPCTWNNTQPGQEVAMENWAEWLQKNGINLPLSKKYMGHIPVQIKNGVFAPR
ncbi:hypothetical protein ABEH08_22935 [Pantoea agglomerans]|uniref:hypothetical protein n=1 Tax=Enterobacter agglomerans TaxID=549 RepID=UPI001654A007|nr:hypothetical protein [Pantoea agglomerans]